jgi:hypothetical protein
MHHTSLLLQCRTCGDLAKCCMQTFPTFSLKTTRHAIMTHVALEVELQAFLTSALDGGKRLASAPRGRAPGYSLNNREDGPQSRSGRYGEEKNLAQFFGNVHAFIMQIRRNNKEDGQCCLLECDAV